MKLTKKTQTLFWYLQYAMLVETKSDKFIYQHSFHRPFSKTLEERMGLICIEAKTLSGSHGY